MVGVDGTADAATEASLDAGGDRVVGDAADAGLCHGMFLPPTLVLAHSAQYWVDSITLSNDELDAFVTLNPVGSVTEQRAIYAMHRTSRTIAFTMDTSQPLNLTNVGPTPGAFDVALSADNLTLYFSHRQDSDAGVLGVNIYDSHRGDAGSTFVTTSELGSAIDDPMTNQFHAHPAGSNLYFTVAQLVNGAQGQRDIFIAPLQGSTRAPIVELNGVTGVVSQQANPVPSRDELEIFFSSDRADPGGANSVYTSNRSSMALPFMPPTSVPLAVADAGTNVTPQHLSADSCRLYILVGQQDAYVSERTAQ
jgi:hypothetical protein